MTTKPRKDHIEMMTMPPVTLLDADRQIDRSAVMREAYRQLGIMKAYGWSFGRCMRNAWYWAKTERMMDVVFMPGADRAAKNSDMAAWWSAVADTARMMREAVLPLDMRK